MKLFIDTADVAQVREAWGWGIIDGVTTNPSHVAKAGRKPSEVYREICDIVDGPISLETIALERRASLKKARSWPRFTRTWSSRCRSSRKGLRR